MPVMFSAFQCDQIESTLAIFFKFIHLIGNYCLLFLSMSFLCHVIQDVKVAVKSPSVLDRKCVADGEGEGIAC